MNNHRENGSRRVVITGMGVVSALGSDLGGFWESLLAGRSGIRRIQSFDPSDYPCQIAGEIPDFDPKDYFKPKEARRMVRASQIGLAAAELAVKDSGLELPLDDPERAGVSLGTGIGGLAAAFEAYYDFRVNGIGKVNPFTIPTAIPNIPTFHISDKFEATGPNTTIATACAAGTQSVGEGADMIRRGYTDVVLSGGTEMVIQDFVLAGFSAMRALPTDYNDRPSEASRPFDINRQGFVLSEGAAGLVLEELEHARARGARIYAEVAGHASSGDAYHMAAPDPSGRGALRTMRWALDSAGVNPEDVDYINAHGTSTKANDEVETLAIKLLFGEDAYNIPVSSTKSMIGHAMGASGSLEAVACALSLYNGVIHPTANLEEPDPACDLDYVPKEAREADVGVTLSNSFGLGGQNACLVLQSF